MREILFRGKKIYGGNWVYGSLIHRGKYCCILQSEKDIHPMDDPYLDSDLGTIDGYATPVDPVTVGQFTGILDKDSKLIFEGDILENHFFDIDNGHGVVVYNDGAFEVSNPIKTVTFHENLWGKDVAVIGNTFDHPELIGGGEE